MQTTLYLERSIDASHVIPGHPGKCGRLHGHTYRFEVWLQGTVDPAGNGMLVDFYDVKSAIDAWDHQHLNDMVDFVPTAELLAAEMHRRLLAIVELRASDATCKVRLWETAGCYAEVGIVDAASDTGRNARSTTATV
jgi:6-pyruvoyltetrahydropterin/6-carboxytetrahydropterin synthase